MAPTEQPTPKLTIHSLEGSRILVTAMFNPKEVSVDKSVGWNRQAASKDDPPALEFTAAEGRSMSFELMFDGFETATDVYSTYVATLEKLASVQDSDGTPDRQRPPKVGIKWTSAMPEFQGVIESVSTKYTMFLPDGTPVRATCRVTVREASRVSVRR